MKICYGVLRQKGYLDHVLAHLCKQPIKKIKSFAYHALHTGLYQLLFLDRVPESAAVNETVKAVAAARLPQSIQGFVNGVLRQSIRTRSELPQPGSDHLMNHPSWLTRRWKNTFGDDEMSRICLVNDQEPPLCLRVVPPATRSGLIDLFSQHGISAIKGRYSPDAVILESYQGAVTALPGFGKALFRIQGQAAQLASQLMAPFRDNHRLLDCCAGVGGKTAHLLSMIGTDSSCIVALEPNRERFTQLQETIALSTRSSQAKMYNQTLDEYSSWRGNTFDGILVDAPCSGTGVIRKHPDIRWNREEGQLHSYQNQQLALLEKAAELLTLGGVLVYATCSIEPEENQQVLHRFLENHTHFHLTDCREYLPSEAHPLIKGKVFAPLPSDEIDGFFAARLTSATESD
jgi:16S rRNA (cytosine967-C5)-methyltransferase